MATVPRILDYKQSSVNIHNNPGSASTPRIPCGFKKQLKMISVILMGKNQVQAYRVVINLRDTMVNRSDVSRNVDSPARSTVTSRDTDSRSFRISRVSPEGNNALLGT